MVRGGQFSASIMARAKPGLFHAYVGVAQIVNWHENTAASYARVLELAQTAGDRQALDALQMIGTPPWHSVKMWPVFRRVLKAYQARIVTAPSVYLHISAACADPEERRQCDAADDFSFMSFWGPTLSGPFTKVDIAALGTRFSIPVFILQGQEDLTALPGITKAWYDRISAPRKELYLTLGAGHDASAIQLTLTQRVLVEEVRPLAIQGSK